MPVAMATTAPTAPPADTPMIPGSAIGLRNSPCIVAPATPRAMPTEAPTTIRGSLICSMTSCSVRPKSVKSSPINDSTIEATWLTGMLTGPRLSETSAVARISRLRIEEPIANRVLTPDRRYPPSVANPTALNENDLQAALRWRSSFGSVRDSTGRPRNHLWCGEWSPSVQAGLLARGWLGPPGPSHRVYDSGLRLQIPLTVALPRRTFTAFPILPGWAPERTVAVFVCWRGWYWPR